MSSGMLTLYRDERKIIETARAANPNTPAYTFAQRLVGTSGLYGRTFFSIYSVVRRFDAKRKTSKKPVNV